MFWKTFGGIYFDFLAKAFDREFPPAPLMAIFEVVESGSMKDSYEAQAISLNIAS